MYIAAMSKKIKAIVSYYLFIYIFICRTIISLVHCDCHIIWLKNILGTSSYFYNPGDINCFSSLPHLNGTDLNFADVSDLNSSCPGKLKLKCLYIDVYMFDSIDINSICIYVF